MCGIFKSSPKKRRLRLGRNPSSAREIIYACQVAKLLVPEEVAVLSGSDDELLCNLLNIPISGILVAAEQIGHLAAQLLDDLINGQTTPKHPILVPPLAVISRQSTDMLAIPNNTLVKALNFIRKNPAAPPFTGPLRGSVTAS